MDDIQISYRLVNVENISFNLKEDSSAFDGVIQVTCNYSFKYDSGKHLIFIILNILSHKEDSVSPFFDITVSYSFEIVEDSWRHLHKNGKLLIPRELACNFLSVAIGTTRGILCCKLEGTMYNRTFVPVLNPFDIVKGNIELA